MSQKDPSSPRPVRAVNASLASTYAGLKPVLQDHAQRYFRFANGQIRRQIGQGHSLAERQARRVANRTVFAYFVKGNPGVLGRKVSSGDIIRAAQQKGVCSQYGL